MHRHKNSPPPRLNFFDHLTILCLLILAILLILLLIGDLGAGKQTLIAGLLAIAGAWFTVQKIQEQILQSERHFSDGRHRKSIAARAALPVALEGIFRYLEQCAVHASKFKNMHVASGNSYDNFHPLVVPDQPAFPTEVILTLKDCIEHSEDDETAKKTARLIREFQTIKSSLNSFHNRYAYHFDAVQLGERERNAENQIIKILRTYSLAYNFFPYADLESDEIDIELNHKNTEISWRSLILKHGMGIPNLATCLEEVHREPHPKSSPIS